MAELAAQLGIDTFDQHLTGDTLVQDPRAYGGCPATCSMARPRHNATVPPLEEIGAAAPLAESALAADDNGERHT